MTSNSQVAYGGLLLLSLFVAVPASLILKKRWAVENPTKQPYGWGYFQGLNSLFGGLLPVMATTESEALLLLVFGGLMTICGVGILKRKRWGWVAGTVLAFNPVLWAVNGVYMSNRWKEMSKEAGNDAETSAPKVPPPMPALTRFYVCYPGGMPFGPYDRATLQRMIRTGEIAPVAQYCQEGSNVWTSSLGDSPRLASVKEWIKDHWLIDPRVYAAVVCAAVLLGWFGHQWLAERYRYQAIGNGVMIRSDRWTGQSWKSSSRGAEWLPMD